MVVYVCLLFRYPTRLDWQCSSFPARIPNVPRNLELMDGRSPLRPFTLRPGQAFFWYHVHNVQRNGSPRAPADIWSSKFESKRRLLRGFSFYV